MVSYLWECLVNPTGVFSRPVALQPTMMHVLYQYQVLFAFDFYPRLKNAFRRCWFWRWIWRLERYTSMHRANTVVPQARIEKPICAYTYICGTLRKCNEKMCPQSTPRRQSISFVRITHNGICGRSRGGSFFTLLTILLPVLIGSDHQPPNGSCLLALIRFYFIIHANAERLYQPQPARCLANGWLGRIID